MPLARISTGRSLSGQDKSALTLLAALAVSLTIHAAALFLTDVDLSTASEPKKITVEIQPPRPPAEKPKPVTAPPIKPKKAAQRVNKTSKPAATAARPVIASTTATDTQAVAAYAQALEAKARALAAKLEAEAKEAEPQQEAVAAPPLEPRLPHQGFIRFVVYMGLQKFEIGRAEHRWEFTDDRYRLVAMTETVGLAALVKPVRMELESSGRLTAAGLQPERMTTHRDGREIKERADFDWDAHRVTLAHDGKQYEMQAGAQDAVSVIYQLAFLGNLADGTDLGVATGRKFERYHLESLGEEDLDTPVGFLHTLHMRVRTNTTIEVWLAVDHQMLPVKIRFTDKKGDSFEQVATEIGM